ncbi:hypothetical protein CLV32_1278 [Pedobacter duraquae]|uniref:Uncharacterized protein n=1 Tax=Pedobacter duraquae TaxID=425511 RepID=A0A4R6IJX9_9SPHI|nr:hypothetical protein CLV32_1278 [Pedobacter duraquae]
MPCLSNKRNLNYFKQYTQYRGTRSKNAYYRIFQAHLRLNNRKKKSAENGMRNPQKIKKRKF